MKLISSQRTRDEDIVADKRTNRDYCVPVTPVFELFGEECRFVLDGGHSYEAAILDGVKPTFDELGTSEDDRIYLLQIGKLEDFFETTWGDSDLYDIETGIDL